MKVGWNELQQRQGWTLEKKIKWALHRIRIWYDYWEGHVYVAFSGGKDSTVLLDLVRRMYPDVPAVFCNTGLEYPEIVKFVGDTENVMVIRPEKTYRRVIKEHGWPVVSKEQSQRIRELRTTQSDKLRAIRSSGPHSVSQCWRFLVDAPFKISEKCCDVMKKRPSRRFELENSLHPYIGTMARDSHLRRQGYLRNGCNAYHVKRPVSRPISIWTTEDVWKYIRRYKIAYSSIYDMGYERTGCIFCAFGVHKEEEPNRFQRLQITHPKLWRYCMEKLGLRDVLIYIGVPWRWKTASSERKSQDVEVHTE